MAVVPENDSMKVTGASRSETVSCSAFLLSMNVATWCLMISHSSESQRSECSHFCCWVLNFEAIRFHHR